MLIPCGIHKPILRCNVKIPVLIEPVPGNGYRARGGEPFADIGEGATPNEALEQLKKSVRHRLDAGARLVSLELSSDTHEWLPFAGMFQENDPVIQKWLAIMKGQREEAEETENWFTNPN